MNYSKILISILVMALVSYLPRVIPLAIFRKPIKNIYIRSFLTYLPYGVLSAMIFPEAFYSTESFISAFFGVAVALFLSFKNCHLMTVSLSACFTVFIVEQLLKLIVL